MPKTKKEKVDPKELEKELEAISKEEGGLDVKENSKDKDKPKSKKASKVASGSISMYLAEIGQYNPLPPDREVELLSESKITMKQQ